jgi:hypothetical protein
MNNHELDPEYCQTLRCIDWAVEKKKKRKDCPPEPIIEDLPPKL